MERGKEKNGKRKERGRRGGGYGKEIEKGKERGRIIRGRIREGERKERGRIG